MFLASLIRGEKFNSNVPMHAAWYLLNPKFYLNPTIGKVKEVIMAFLIICKDWFQALSIRLKTSCHSIKLLRAFLPCKLLLETKTKKHQAKF